MFGKKEIDTTKMFHVVECAGKDKFYEKVEEYVKVGYTPVYESLCTPNMGFYTMIVKRDD